MKLARNVFRIAGIWGLLVLPPMYFMFDYIGRAYPPQITHPDFYYGFLGVALAWQIAFLMIATDPVRYRPLMPAAILEKFSFVASTAVLYTQGQLQAGQLAPAAADLALGVLFVVAFFRTPARFEPAVTP